MASILRWAASHSTRHKIKIQRWIIICFCHRFDPVDITFCIISDMMVKINWCFPNEIIYLTVEMKIRKKQKNVRQSKNNVKRDFKNDFERWNLYFFYLCERKVKDSVKYQIENDKYFSSGKAVESILCVNYCKIV